MTLRRLLSVLTLAAAVSACETPAEPSADLGSTLDPDGYPAPSTPLNASAPVAWASGAAHRSADDLPVILNFSARLHADGTASGNYYYRAVTNGTWIRVGVTCMSVRGDNEAWIAGIIEASSIPTLVGTVSYFYTFDNGEGAKADPDTVSLVRAADVAGEDEAFCRDQPTLLPARDVLHGNVNVRVAR